MTWTNLCIEAFCFGESEDDGNYPCGRNCPSHLCLENGHCPHLVYSETTERAVAQFPKFHLIVKDRLGIWADRLYWRLRWWLWDCLWFNRRKVDEFFNSIPVATREDSPIIAELEDEENKAREEFKEWRKMI